MLRVQRRGRKLKTERLYGLVEGQGQKKGGEGQEKEHETQQARGGRTREL